MVHKSFIKVGVERCVEYFHDCLSNYSGKTNNKNEKKTKTNGNFQFNLVVLLILIGIGSLIVGGLILNSQTIPNTLVKGLYEVGSDIPGEIYSIITGFVAEGDDSGGDSGLEDGDNGGESEGGIGDSGGDSGAGEEGDDESGDSEESTSESGDSVEKSSDETEEAESEDEEAKEIESEEEIEDGEEEEIQEDETKEEVEDDVEDIEEGKAEKEINDTEIEDGGQNETITEKERSTAPSEHNDTISNYTINNRTISNKTIRNETGVVVSNDTTISNGTISNDSLVNETIINETEPTTPSINVTEFNSSKKNSRIVINRPVKWVEVINTTFLNDSGNLTLDLPKGSQNITVKTGQEVEKALEELEDYEITLKNADRTEIVEGTITGLVSSDVGGNGLISRLLRWWRKITLTGRVIQEDELSEEIRETSGRKEIDLSGIIETKLGEEIAVEYYTEAPVSYEMNISEGKKVVIYGPDELNYTDVLAYSEIPEIFKVGQEDRIKVYWYNEVKKEDVVIEDDSKVGENDTIVNEIISNETDENGGEETEVVVIDENNESQLIPSVDNDSFVNDSEANGTSVITGAVILEEENETIINDSESDNYIEIEKVEKIVTSSEVVREVVSFTALDLDGNGLIDYVEWNVPHLSNQTYDIILVIGAEHLDSNRTFISDIFEEVKALDGNWSETIPDQHFVRVTFEVNLSSDRDITLYPRSSGNGSISETRIEVYEVNKSVLIAEFVNIIENGYNTIYLSNLGNKTQDTFDMKVVNGSLEFDHIIDPSADPYAILNAPANDSVFNLNSNIRLNATVFDTESTMDVAFYGVNFSTSAGDFNKHGLIHRSINVSNGSEVTYDWGAPTIIPEKNSVFLFHMDNNSDFGENQTYLYDYVWGIHNSSSISGTVEPNMSGGKFGGGLEFILGTVLLVENSSIYFDDNANYTWSVWINPKSLDRDHRILYKARSGLCVGDCGWTILVEDNNNISFAETSTFDDESTNILHSTTQVTTDRWYHVAITYNTENDIRLYVDGVLEANGTGGMADSNTGQVGLGSTSGVHGPNMTIDEVAMWNRTLSAAEVLDLYRLREDKYVWKVNISDSSGNQNESEVREFYINLTGITSCGTLSQENTIYKLENNIWTNDTCLISTVGNITIDGQGYNITGNGSTPTSQGIRSYNNNLTVINITVTNFTTSVTVEGTGDGNLGGNLTVNLSKLETASAKGGDGDHPGEDGTKAGFMRVFNSHIDVVDVTGGIGQTGGNGAAGGPAYVYDSNSTTIKTHGGIGTAAGSGGKVFVYYSNVTIIDAHGAQGGGGGNPSGSGGNIYIENVDINLSGGYLNVTDGTAAVDPDPGKIILNYSGIFEDLNTLYGNKIAELTIINASAGKIYWLNEFTSTPIRNLSSNVIISDNFVSVDSVLLNNLNTTANVTLYNMENKGFSAPEILRDGIACGSCYNFTPLNASIVEFNVSYWTNYSIGDNVSLTDCGTLDTANAVYKLLNNITTTGSCFEITNHNITLDGQGYTITGDHSADSYGINSSIGGGGTINTTIKNITVTDFGYGLWLDAPGYGVVEDVITRSNSDYGIKGFSLTNFKRIRSFDENISLDIASGNHIQDVLIENSSKRGIEISGNVDHNVLVNVTINGSKGVAIYIQSINTKSPNNNTLKNITITNTAGTGYDLNVTSVPGWIPDDIRFVDVGIANYTLGSVGSKLYFEDSRFGLIKFTNGINGTGTNLSDDIRIGNNSVVVESGNNPGLNVSANITLYGIGDRGSGDPLILRNGVDCGSVCHNFSGLEESTVTFNVSYWTNYSIGYNSSRLKECAILDSANTLYTLLNDVSTTTTCFNITADNVTLDGQGYNVDGDDEISDDYGVYAANQSNLTIRNLNITNFSNGIYFSEVNDSLLKDNTLYSNVKEAVFLSGSYSNKLTNNTIFDNNDGIYLDANSSYNNITNNTVNDNGDDGIYVRHSSNNQIRGNYVNGSGNSGIELDGGANHEVIGNNASSNEEGLQLLRHSTQNDIINNTFNNNEEGIQFNPGHNNTIKSNTLNNNTNFGFTSTNSGNNSIINNSADGNRFDGISINGGDSNLIVNNSASDNDRYGLLVSTSSNNIFENNIVNNSGGSAIFIQQSPPTAITSNNNFTNISITNTNSSHYDIYFRYSGTNGTYLIDMPHIGNYSINGTGSLIYFKDSLFGEIKFIDGINGTGDNLTSDIQIGNNSVFVNSDSNRGLNKSANVTLYRIGNRGLNSPSILRDGVYCGSVCSNFTNLTAQTVRFNVSYWTNYSIGESVPFIFNAEINSSTPVVNNTLIKVNASITNGSALDNVVIQVKQPNETRINITTTKSGDEYYNDTILLNQEGAYVFTFFANTTGGGSAQATANTTGDDIPLIEVSQDVFLAESRIIGLDTTPASGDTYAVAYCDDDEQDKTYAVYYTNGTIKAGPFDIAEDAGDCLIDDSISITAVNDEYLVIVYQDNGFTKGGIYDHYGNLSENSTEAISVTSSSGSSVAALGSSTIVVGYLDTADEQHIRYKYYTANTGEGLEFEGGGFVANVDGNIGPGISVTGYNSSAFVIAWHENDQGGSGPDIRHMNKDISGYNYSAEETIDVKTGNHEVSVAAFNTTAYGLLYRNGNTLLLRYSDIDGSAIGSTQTVANIANSSSIELSYLNDTHLLLGYFDAISNKQTVNIFEIDLFDVPDSRQINVGPHGQAAIGIAGGVLSTGIEICDDNIVAAWGQTNFSAYLNNFNGNNLSRWGGKCLSEVSSCETLDTANNIYTIQNDMSTTGTCFQISGDNITLDGAGYVIDGDDGAGDSGINIGSGVKNATIMGLTIKDFGYGVWAEGATNNTIWNNSITSSTEGIHFEEGATHNYIHSNEFNDTTSYAIYTISSSTDTDIRNNTFYRSGEVRIEEGSNRAFLVGNTFESSTGISIHINDGSTYIDIRDGSINNSKGDAIRLTSDTDNINISNVSITNTNSSVFDLRVSDDGIDEIYITDMPHIGNYSFNNNTVSFEDTNFGMVMFIDRINGTGTNLTRDVFIGNNTVSVRSDLNNGLNKSANVTLYGIGDRGFRIPELKKDHLACGKGCSNFTNLTAVNVRFNVTSWTNHSVGDGTDLSDCGVLDLPNTNYTLKKDVSTTGTCFNITAHNVSLEGDGFNADGDLGASDYGVLVDGMVNSTIKNLNISDFGIGVFLTNGANDSTILNNSIQNSTKGIDVTSSKGFEVVNNSIVYSFARSIEVNSGSDNGNITGNSIIVSGDDAIFCVSAMNLSIGNNIIANMTFANDGDGVFLFSSCTDTIVFGNSITNMRDGISIGSNSKNIFVINNTIEDLTQDGIIFSSSDGHSILKNNTIINASTGLSINDGDNFTILDLNVSNSRSLGMDVSGSNLSIFNSTVDITGSHGIRISDTLNLNITNVSLANVNKSSNEILFDIVNNDTYLIDMPHIGNYTISGDGSALAFKKTGVGEIKFLISINGTGDNLSNDIRILNNSVVVETGNNLGLNRSANVTLYNIGDRGFAIPAMLRNGGACGTVCANLTNLTASTIRFNVSYWTNYSIGDGDFVAPSVILNTPTNNSNFTIGIANISINVTVFDNVNPINVFIHGTNVSDDFYNHTLLYQEFEVANGSEIIYNWTSNVLHNRFAPSKMVGLWHMDNRSQFGENDSYVYDFEGGNNNGTSVGGLRGNNSGGKFAGGFELDGIDDYIDVHGLDSAIDVFTFMGWFKTNELDGTIVGDWYTGGGLPPADYGWKVSLVNGNVTLTIGCGASDCEDSLTYGKNVSDGEWHHFAVQYNNLNDTENTQIYVDGERIIGNISSAIADDASRELWFGEAKGQSDLFNGTIDDFARWEAEGGLISKERVKSFYRLDKGTYYWKVNVTDKNRNSNESETFVLRINGDTILPYSVLNNPPNDSNFDIGTGNVTLNGTVYDNSPGDLLEVYIFGSNSSNTGNMFKHGLLYQSFDVPNATEVTYNWTAPTIIPEEYTILLYHLDNRSSYGESDNLVKDFNFDVADDGTPQGDAKPNITGGKFAGGYVFDGYGDNITINTNSTLIGFVDSQNYSWAMWVKLNQVNRDHWLIKKNSGICGPDCQGYLIYIEDNNNFTFGKVSTDSDHSEMVLEAPTSLSANRWYHLAVTFNSENDVRIYVDGQLDGNTSSDYASENSNIVVVGGGSENLSHSLNGTLDEIGIWNKTLTAGEINDLYRLNADKYFWQINTTDSTGGHNASVRREFTVFGEDQLTTCGVLDSANANYKLQNDVSSAGTCFTIGAENITLDGQSYLINYSQVGMGHAVANNDSNGFNNITLRNLNIVQGNNISNADAISYDNSGNGTIENNNITTSGTNARAIEINSNGITVTGNSLTSPDSDVLVLTSSSSHNVTRNIITTTSTTKMGIIIAQTSNTVIAINNITALNRGIDLSICSGISIEHNNITLDDEDTTGANAISYLDCTTGTNDILYNKIIVTNEESNGITVDESVRNITGNNVTAGNFGTASLDLVTNNASVFGNTFDPVLGGNGIVITGDDNVIEQNKFANNAGPAIRLHTGSENNNITNNTFPPNVRHHINFSGGTNNTYFIDQVINNYTFGDIGGRVNFKDSEFGEIRFLSAVTGSGTNLSEKIKISNNSVIVDSTENNGLNVSANVSLYGIGDRGFNVPEIKRDGATCGSVCSNFTGLDEDTVRFNVSWWTNYSIGDLTQLTSCGTLDSANTIYTLENDASTTGTCLTIAANNITLDLNGFNISGDASGEFDFGIEVGAYNFTTIKNGEIYDFGRGIEAAGAYNGNFTNLTIRAIGGFGFSTTAYGISIVSGDNFSIFNNNISYTNLTSGTDNYIAIYISISNNNSIENNEIRFNRAGVSRGISLINVNNSLIRGNNISNSSRGVNNADIGIAVGGYSNIISNNILSGGSASTGLSLSSIDNSIIVGNIISSYGTGIDISASENNLISGGLINGSIGSAILINMLFLSDSPNNFTNISIVNTNASHFDLTIPTSGNGTTLIDMPHIGNYSINSSKIMIKDSTFGEIKFLNAINGTGTNLTNDIRIRNNSVTVESNNNPGLNRSANVTLYNIGNTGFNLPQLQRDGVDCGSVCANFTALNSGNVSFNVSYWTNYSIGEGDVIGPQVTIFFPENRTYGVVNLPLRFNVSLSENGTVIYSLDGGKHNVSMTTGDNRNYFQTNASIADGSYTFTAYATDSASNENFTESITFGVDQSFPKVNVTSPENITYTANPITFSLTTNEFSFVQYHLGNGTSNVTMTANESNTGFTSSISPANGDYTVFFLVNDSAGNRNDTFNVSFTVEVPTPPDGGDEGGGGGGGGGAPTKPPLDKLNFETDKDLIEVDVVKGTTLREKITVTNVDNKVITIDNIRVTGVDRFMKLSESSFSLSPGDSKEVIIDIFANEDERVDTYAGAILFEATGGAKQVYVLLNVKDKAPLFDITVDIDKDNIIPGEDVIGFIDIFNLGDLKNVNIKLYYAVLDFQQKVIVEETELLSIERRVGLVRSLQLPIDIAFGKYIYYARVEYEDSKGNLVVATGSKAFDVSDVTLSPFLSRIIKIILWTLAIIAILVVIIVIILFLRRREEEEPVKRKVVSKPVIPKSKAPRVVYVGGGR
jgi:parallel beta-helix repeat protein